MLYTIAILTTVFALLGAVVLFFAVDGVPASRGGWVAIFTCVAVLPLLATTSGTTHAVQTSSTTEFCLDCHEMEDYGRSLFVDDPAVLPAVHYQNRSVPRESSCYACHTNYAMFGDLEAKLNGLRHVYVHYLGDMPEQMELYEPYPNSNCLHCHDDARNYLEIEAHADKREALASGEISCLKCHSRGHAFEDVEEGNLWLGQ